MSALSLMCRKATLAIALVALTAAGVHAASTSTPAKLHQHPSATARAQTTHHATLAPGNHRTAPAHTRAQTQASTTRKPTSRAAGLATRRKLAHQQHVRRNVNFHVDPSHATSRPVSERALRSTKETRAAPAMEFASASPVFLSRPAQAEEPAPEELQQPAAKTPDAKTPDAKTPNAKTEQASLRVPLRANPAPLRGSHESLERQNARLDADGLERIEDESDLADRIDRKLLVPIPASSALAVNAELSATHRYCRPWTALFLADLARAHNAAFHRPLEVSSAVRTMEYQKRLMEINGNAAPAEGDIVSPHLTGATIDIAKDGLSRKELAWMRSRLLALEAADKIDVEEEFRQACFHITVYKSYTPPSTPRPATQAGSGSAGTKRHKAADHSGAVAAQGL
ncbi:MAG: DUF5715 family protein [Terracidiphilus sp.]|nr:DUF5715 family protein [Terracidiphilus sp.]MDR3796720.1 DUF5715 family protein [Terracidiphilus sp.]